MSEWRRGRDSNPRYGFPYSSFQDWRLQPLGHLSGITTVLLQLATIHPEVGEQFFGFQYVTNAAGSSTAVFKTGAINHSATSPLLQFYYSLEYFQAASADVFSIPTTGGDPSRRAFRDD